MRRRIRFGDLPPDLVARMKGTIPPPDFEFDGVSGWLDTFLGWDRRPAAGVHDLAYSTPSGIEDRLEADRLLFRNLKRSYMGTVAAMAFYVAVRLFGWRHFTYSKPLDRWVDAAAVFAKSAVVAAAGYGLWLLF